MIKIYTIENCPQCQYAKSMMKKNGIEYEEINGKNASSSHKNWREDKSVEFMTFLQYCNEEFPIFYIEENWYNYKDGCNKMNFKSMICEDDKCVL